MSHGDEDVQVEAVVRLPEEEDEDEAEETGAGETPVQPGKLCMKGTDRERDMFESDCNEQCDASGGWGDNTDLLKDTSAV